LALRRHGSEGGREQTRLADPVLLYQKLSRRGRKLTLMYLTPDSTIPFFCGSLGEITTGKIHMRISGKRGMRSWSNHRSG